MGTLLTVSTIVLTILLFIIVIIYITRLYVTIFYDNHHQENVLEITITFWKFISIQKTIPLNIQAVNDEEKDIEPNMTDTFFQFVRKKINSLRDLIAAVPYVRQLLKQFSIHKLKWDTSIGNQDAMLTGLICGAVWGVKGSVIGLMGQQMNLLSTPYINVTPQYNKNNGVKSSLECMISFKVGKTIHTFIRLLRFMKRRKSKRNKH
ncbi:DUF2953 domain-containing protein [Salirhabdus salicampi]|uniref:DUF2953 domain-containing protein n=1 Tax=Salirhabdus salicampi TaxID=476102 RepID=UPI0020C4400A|nr:DUF2953 domain-containing protein [Salirhabdus salicampi]MCP8617124.1 DUF2953 domain-containing protein [Salirhabdus salicampi]